jgi:hypothetical protein
MKWLKSLLGIPTPKPRTMLDAVHDVVVQGYRRIGREAGTAPTSQTSDAEILEIYSLVLTAFKDAAQKRGERIPALNLNAIAWKFLITKEMAGREFMEEHLRYEVQKYLAEGLREDYRRELPLV